MVCYTDLSIHPLWIHQSIHPSIDLNQTDKILQEFDAIMAPCAKNNDHFDLLDTASLLWRLNVSYSSLSMNHHCNTGDGYRPRTGKMEVSDWCISNLHREPSTYLVSHPSLWCFKTVFISDPLFVILGLKLPIRGKEDSILILILLCEWVLFYQQAFCSSHDVVMSR